jgi:hypothetical protein
MCSSPHSQDGQGAVRRRNFRRRGHPPERDAEGSPSGLKDEDQEAVRRIFGVLFDFVDKLSPQFQLIVTDHADLSDER